MSTPDSNNIALNHADSYAYIAQLRAYFYEINRFRVQTSHFYVYCFNESAYPYVKIPTVMSV